MCDLHRVRFIVLGLEPMDGAHIQGVAKNELDTGIQTGIGQPVPVECALTAHSEPMSIRLNQAQKILEVIAAYVPMDKDIALSVHDADVHHS